MAPLRERLRPLRPVLLPIWRVAEPIVSGGSRLSIPTLASRLTSAVGDVASRARGARPRPIRALRRHEIVDLAAREPYYRPRIGYMRVAADEASRLIDRDDLRTALELGPNLRSLIVGADVMDIREQDRLEAEGRRVVADARQAPWPFDDKAYDLFMALQVFEHLGDRQPEAFREVCRVARHAMLSLPIDWVMDDPRNCHHGLTNEKVLSWFAPVVPTRVLVGNPGRRKRLLYVFENLPPPDGDPVAA